VFGCLGPEGRDHGSVVGAWVVALGLRLVCDGWEFDLAGGDGGDRAAEGVADQQVVDQFTADGRRSGRNSVESALASIHR
jgi:hypothetical protein